MMRIPKPSSLEAACAQNSNKISKKLEGMRPVETLPSVLRIVLNLS